MAEDEDQEIRNYRQLMDLYGLLPTGDDEADERALAKAVYKATSCGAVVLFFRTIDCDVELVIGVQVGSIIEGSDVEIGPYDMMFPFTVGAWRDMVDTVEKEADLEWKIANEPVSELGIDKIVEASEEILEEDEKED